jgi:hypothetical protein
MPCNPSNNNLAPVVFPGLPIPGFGNPFAPIQPPIPGFKLPEGFPEKILELLDKLKINWPGGIINPQIPNFAATLLDGLMNLFSMLQPFLSIYNFFTALLNMVMCIIDVICAIPNPYKLIRAIRRLIKDCLPPFLNLFPWMALIAMIISIILLLIALITYIIARVLEIIQDILANLQLLASGITLQDAESTVAVAFKIASLLCIIENLMAMLSAIAAIMAIIDTLSMIAGKKICSGSDESDCCGDDVCPPFIRNNPNGIVGTQGRIIYHRQIIDPTAANNPLFSAMFGSKITGNTIRKELWQLVNDDSTEEYPFKTIITQYKDNTTERNSSNGSSYNSTDFEYGDIFWPEGNTFYETTSLRKAPYSVNLTLSNLQNFDNGYTGETTTFVVKNVIVESKPYIGVRDETGSVVEEDNLDGTLSLVGGLVYDENDNPILVNGAQLTLEDLVHLDPVQSASVPSVNDGYDLDAEFTLNINHAALVGYGLITLGCAPEVASETARLNDELAISIDPVITRVGPMPDIATAQACVAAIIADLRQEVSPSKVEAAQADIIACLETLNADAEDVLCKALIAGIDVYSSEFTLYPDLQFLADRIKVSVVLKDKAGVIISNGLPENCAADIAKDLRGEVSLGVLTSFLYNSATGVFEAYISSDIGGDGILKMSWKNNMFLEKLNTDNPDIDTVVQERSLPYTFVSSSSVWADKTGGKVRRDATDVSEG